MWPLLWFFGTNPPPSSITGTARCLSSVVPMCGCGGPRSCRLARDGNQSCAAFEGGSAPGGCGGGFGGPCHELLLSRGALCCPCGCLHLAVSLWDARIIMASSDSPELVPDILIAAWLIIAMECNYNVATVTSDSTAI